MSKLAIVLASFGIISAVITTSVVITADNIKELRKVDNNHRENIYELKIQTSVISNELFNIKETLKEHSIQLKEQNKELREIKLILRKMYDGE